MIDPLLPKVQAFLTQAPFGWGRAEGDLLPWLAAGGLLGLSGGLLWWAGGMLARRRVGAELLQRTRTLEETARRHRLMADHAYDFIAVTDRSGRLSYANAAGTRLLGYSVEELRARNILDLVHPRQRPTVEAALQRVVSSGLPADLPCQLATQAGGWLHVEVAAHGLPGPDWVVRDVVLHCRDVSQRQQMLESLARNEQRFRDFAASSADWLWETDRLGRFQYISPGVTQVLGFGPDDLLGQPQLPSLFATEDDPVRDLIASRIDRRQPYRELEFWTAAKDGARVCLRLSGVPVFDSAQEFIGYRGAASNITASKLERDQVYRLATTDHLTGLLNSLRFKEELERAVALARRHHTKGVVLFIDLDRFKEINDTHGHEAGDRILQGVADILRDSVRSTDVVARRGGDEFSIIMHNIEVGQAVQKVQQMITKVKGFGVDYGGTRLTVTMSVGMVQYPVPEAEREDRTAPDNARLAEQLIMSADLAMYKAKDMGRNRLFVDAADATGETVGSVRAMLKWVERLRGCLEREEFELHYQAIVPDRGLGLGSPRPLAEALLRIYDEEGKVGSPALYIDAAEHFGLIQQLDLAVVKRVFQTQAKLMKAGIDVDVSINLSCRTLGDPAVVPKLQQLLAESPIDPARVVFEVTETMALHDPAQMRDVEDIKAFIEALRGMGFRFALDDFGTGFTSFRYLKVLPVDIVKIDGEYIKNIVHDANDRLFVQQMVGLAQGLGIKTIAEFVEDREILAVLRELGVDGGQGWLFAKPQPDLQALTEAYAGKVMGDWAEAPPLLSVARGETPAAPLKLRKPMRRKPAAPLKAAAPEAGPAAAHAAAGSKGLKPPAKV